ncbi:MAG: PEP-CTERM sorting domain-containing protein [Phycisphaerales bacterium]|nr:PEP-CTERM sorting domain-containing protein [Phycisphaerales bacterium]
MNKIAIIAGLALTASAMTASAVETLLDIDLSVTNQLTITATGSNALVTASGSNFTGFLLAGFLNAADAGAGPGISDGVGDLTTANQTSDLGPSIFNGGSSVGINIWAFTAGGVDATTTAGFAAFSGSATWTVDASVYAALLNGNINGDVYLNADTDDDIGAGGILIGAWGVKIPAPGSMALLGLGGLVAGRRRR